MTTITFNFTSQGKYEQAKTVAKTPTPKSGYKKDEKVIILWKEKWYPGKIIEVSGDKFKVSYDGFGEEWNEEVGLKRLKKM